MDSDAVDEILEQWRTERPDLDASPMGVFGRLARTHALASQHLRRLLGEHDLTPAMFDVLANLRRSGAPHRKTAGDLAASSMLSTGGTTFRIDRLESRGLVRRISGEDRRVTMVELTHTGRELIDEVMGHHLTQEQQLLAAMDPTDRQDLAQLLSRLERSMAAKGEHACNPPRSTMCQPNPSSRP